MHLLINLQSLSAIVRNTNLGNWNIVAELHLLRALHLWQTSCKLASAQNYLVLPPLFIV